MKLGKSFFGDYDESIEEGVFLMSFYPSSDLCIFPVPGVPDDYLILLLQGPISGNLQIYLNFNLCKCAN